ncbi:hypothetical protein [Streptomyces laculatispora]|uniref:hypothetical protein n=1 Tax=Streptomyces laculatispora TaxID=887464 RepID=UPI001A93C18E|nr:hypothetical protein [Streptomyces laculatispora]MBO0915142.1 hypothetical protein [Streptomyces laculatispora]
MPAHSPFTVVWDKNQRAVLEQLAHSRTAPLRRIQRAEVVLAAADGISNAAIARSHRLIDFHPDFAGHGAGVSLAEIDVEVARLEAAEVVFGQYAEATDGDRRDDPVEPDPVATQASGAGGMLLVPHRVEGMSEEVLPAGYQRIVQVVAGASDGPVKAWEVCEELRLGVLPAQPEAMRGKLKRLADRGWLHRTPSGRYGPR